MARASPSSSNPITILDLCTGSGCIPLLLCHVLREHHVRAIGVDISGSAITLARENATRAGISVAEDNFDKCDQSTHQSATACTFLPIQASILDHAFKRLIAQYGAPFDVITANPPYIPKHEYDELSRSVRDYEDSRALLGDPGIQDSGTEWNLSLRHRERGLVFYVVIAKLLHEGILKRGGCIALEVGHDQAHEVRTILEDAGIKRTEIWADFAGVERVVLGWS
jgi:methylase of polypeptide subunit release factors